MERAKIIIEIVAIVVGGGWTWYEHVYQVGQERKRGESLSWATLRLDGDVARLSDARAWLNVRLHAKNESKRALTPFIVSWWVKLPPSPGSVSAQPYKMWNEGVGLGLAPGQETEISSSVVVEAKKESVLPEAVFVHVEMVFRGMEEDEECIFDPSHYEQQLQREEFEAMTEQPRFCLRDPGASGNACLRMAGGGISGCPTETAERVFALPRSSPREGDLQQASSRRRY